MSSATRIIKRLESRDPYTPGPTTISGCEYLAYELFQLIREHHGERQTRRIFAKWATPPTPQKLRLFSNLALFDRLDLMKPKPNMQKLAREIAAENREKKPRERPKGPAGSINELALDRHIRRLCAKRKAAMKRNVWWGPFPPDIST